MRGNKVRQLMTNKFQNWDFYSSPITEGRILIIWRKILLKVIVLEETNQYVHCYIKMAGQKHPFSATFVYGLNTMEERKILWQSLPRLSLLASSWVILGDFNAIFTTKDRNGDGSVRIYSKIDHVLANEEWLDFFPNTTAMFSWETVSDHCSCTISILAAKDHYQAALFQAQQHPRDFTLQDKAKAAADAFIIQEHMYHSFLAHRSKLTWLRKGDMNTAYFRACLKKRKEENRIATYIIEQGRVVDNFSEVVSNFLNYLKSFMGSLSSATKKINRQCVKMGSKLSIDQQIQLLKPFSHKEIRDTIFSIPNTKSPGPDGFGFAFFKELWQEIGSEVCRVVGQFFETGRIPEELLNTTLSLVPKTDNPSQVVDYRPIACCSTLCKYDLILFCRGSLSVVKVVKGALGDFSSATGLQINASKSHIYFGGVSAEDRQMIVAEIQLSEGTFPLKYLGVPMRPTKWKHEDCDIIIQKSKIHVASWSKVCLPKAYGGLGFRNGSVWNRVILAKSICAISEKHDVLWELRRKLGNLAWLWLGEEIQQQSFIESHSHLFFDCHLSKQVMELIFDWMVFKAWSIEFAGWKVWLTSRKPGLLFSLTNMILAAAVYNRWRNRNRCIFDRFSWAAVGMQKSFEKKSSCIETIAKRKL
ncbi:uncharacterized protein LOC133785209 [Humulus lupulus]|uniref:uncharacterized protein LOC133785209 n=1 Tax=Humulus lupulus TaxID=3486 RepID=UPI002B413B56|nr:uncharacterized protein LOC133785209 [Humulus lupulus]